MTKVDWTPETVERVKTMWQDGRSASEIAATIPGATRNGVIGKVHRMGLSNKDQVRREPWAPGSVRSPWAADLVERVMALHNDNTGPTRIAATLGLRYAQVRSWMRRNGVTPCREDFVKARQTYTPRPPKPVTSVEPVNAPPGAKPWTSRAFGECARPVAGDGADTWSCAMPVAPGRQYCLACCALMFVPTVPAPVSKMWGART